MSKRQIRRTITFAEFAISFGLFAIGTLAVTIFVTLVPIF
jgi:hypothetical protein